MPKSHKEIRVITQSLCGLILQLPFRWKRAPAERLPPMFVAISLRTILCSEQIAMSCNVLFLSRLSFPVKPRTKRRPWRLDPLRHAHSSTIHNPGG